jgi:hypothetical protein
MKQEENLPNSSKMTAENAAQENVSENVANQQPDATNADAPKPKERKPWWRRAIKIAAWCVGGIAALILLIMVTITIFLTPERLGQLVTKYAGEFIEADVKVESIDYTIWSSFPYVTVSVDDATVVAKTLKSLPKSVRDSLPADCDTLGSIKSFHGRLNPWPLLIGRISVKEANLDGLALNLVAVNDSVANYLISKPTEEEEEEPISVPHFTMEEVTITNTQYVKYFSAATQVAALVNLNDVSLKDTDTSNLYNFILNGNVGFNYEDMEVLRGFPFRFSGSLAFDFDPFRITLDKYSLNLGNLMSKVDLDMEISDDSQIRSFDYQISPFSVMKFLKYLPASLLPDMEGIDSDMKVQASLKLTAPYHFSSEKLPSFALDFSVPDSYIAYTLENVGTYNIHNIGMHATLDFNGDAPEKSVFKLPMFTLAGEGVTFDVNATATNIMKSPDVDLCVEGNADFAQLSKYLAKMLGMTIAGALDCDIDMKFNYDELMAGEYNKMEINGTADMKGLAFNYPAEEMSMKSRTANLKFGNKVTRLGNFVSKQGLLAFSADVDTLILKIPGYDTSLGGISLRGGTTQAMLSRTDEKEIVPLGLAFDANTVKALAEADSTHLMGRKLSLTGTVEKYQNSTTSPLFTAALKAGGVAYRDPTMFGAFKDVDASLNIHLNSKKSGTRSARYQARYDSIAKAHPNLSADSIAVLARSSRKKANYNENEVVAVELDKTFKDLIKQWDVSGNVKASKGVFAAYFYPTRTRIENLNMGFSFDSIALRSLTIKSQSNVLNVNGKITNLRKAMLGKTRSPIKMRLNVNADTLNINQMAATYEKGEKLQQQLVADGKLPPESVEQIESMANNAEATATTDSFTVIVPRNVDAEMKFNVKNVVYTDLNVYDIGARLQMQDGAFNIDGLKGHTDFGSAYLNMLYSTRDINDILMSLDLGFEKIDVNMFFNRFSQFKEMMPIMENLSGFVSAKVACSTRLLPSMDLDFPSVRAVLEIRGNDLKVHQDALIRKVARLLLIGNHDININDMLIQVSIHDNLLELYPFLFEFDRYKLGLLGENDFDGNMYYHVSILKSPIPFRWGINIKGNMDKYKIRFGGAKYHSDQATKLVNLVDERRVNLVKEMRQFVNKAIKKASLHDVGSPQLNMLNSKEETAPSDATQLSSPIRILLQNQSKLQEILDAQQAGQAAATSTNKSTKKKKK